MLKETPVIQLEAADDIAGIYAAAREQQLRGESTVLVEYKDFL